MMIIFTWKVEEEDEEKEEQEDVVLHYTIPRYIVSASRRTDPSILYSQSTHTIFPTKQAYSIPPPMQTDTEESKTGRPRFLVSCNDTKLMRKDNEVWACA